MIQTKMKFDDWLLSTKVKETLNHVYNMQPANAFLFCGTHGSGALRAAHYFSQAYLCEEKKGTVPCGQCKNCLQVQKNIHPDVFVVKAEGKWISIKDIRAFKEKFYQRSFLNSYKIAIIQDIERLTVSASNALLKIFEEPPIQSKIIMTASEISSVLSTIRSRAVMVEFPLLSDREMIKYFNEQGLIGLDASSAVFIARGRGDIAQHIIEDTSFFEEEREKIRDFLDIIVTTHIENERKYILQTETEDVYDMCVYTLRNALHSDLNIYHNDLMGDTSVDKDQLMKSMDLIIDMKKNAQKIAVNKDFLNESILLSTKKVFF